ncbi:tigger transposable element-derived protein 6-like [Zootermopsis nevadensis]|uniref:tigger transposable element-derived protein 6-like n=1 Tax=Zootermopsis nevadensis TaxID=136037 RepID=UPI000B8E8F27|nr:tigger transposable element-derived protein 6-like [Zootermopsis nevadensis]
MGKRKLVELTLEKKKEVLDLLKIGESCRKLAEKYGISKSTVSNINSNRAAITDAWERKCNAHRKRLRKTPHDELNDKVLEFFRCCRAKNIPISGTLLQEKAREIATRLHTEDFSASNGWLDRFRKRNNISLHVLSGESASADLQAAEDWKRKLPSLLLGYAEEDISNADETGLFYRQLPTRSLIEMRDTCKGGKKCKGRITVLLCCNSRGAKLKPLVIGNAARPRAFKTNNVKLDDLPEVPDSDLSQDTYYPEGVPNFQDSYPERVCVFPQSLQENVNSIL